MSKKLFLIAPVALMIASLSASADHRDFRPAVAYRAPSLPVIAHDLDRAARELNAQAAHEIFPRGRRRVEALAAIRQFELDARRFHALVENRHGRTRRSHLAFEFERLERSFDRTAWTLERNIRPSRALAQNFRRVEISMSRLDDRI